MLSSLINFAKFEKIDVEHFEKSGGGLESSQIFVMQLNDECKASYEPRLSTSTGTVVDNGWTFSKLCIKDTKFCRFFTLQVIAPGVSETFSILVPLILFLGSLNADAVVAVVISRKVEWMKLVWT